VSKVKKSPRILSLKSYPPLYRTVITTDSDYSDNDDDDAATNDKPFYDERTERTMNATDVSFFAFFLSGVSDMCAHTHTHPHTYKPRIEDSYDDNPGLMDEEEALNEAQDDGTGFVVVDYEHSVAAGVGDHHSDPTLGGVVYLIEDASSIRRMPKTEGVDTDSCLGEGCRKPSWKKSPGTRLMNYGKFDFLL
jgi:hypothetical protein